MISETKALQLAVKALKDQRRRNHAAGHKAFLQGVDFEFAKRDHKAYEELTDAIATLENRSSLLTAAHKIAKLYKEKT